MVFNEADDENFFLAVEYNGTSFLLETGDNHLPSAFLLNGDALFTVNRFPVGDVFILDNFSFGEIEMPTLNRKGTDFFRLQSFRTRLSFIKSKRWSFLLKEGNMFSFDWRLIHYLRKR